MRFIPIDKMKKLREASRSGDERAKKILAMQLGGEEDFSGLLEEYFKPQPEVQVPNNLGGVVEGKATSEKDNPKLMQFLKDNNITDDSPERDSFIEDYYVENPNERPQEVVEEKEDVLDMTKLIDDEIEAINGYTKFLNNLLAANECEKIKALINNKITKIIEDEKQHIETLKLLEKCINKEGEHNENEGTIQQ